MAPQALVLSHDPDVLRTVRRVLNDLGMRVEVCTGPERASELVEQRKFDVAVVDVDGAPGAAAVLSEMRQSASNRDTMAFALLGGVTSPQRAFELGANLALEKPLSMDRAVRGFRAAHGLVVKERRRFYRHQVEMPVSVMIGTDETQVTASAVSEGGMAILTKRPIQAGSTVQVRFKLPDSKDWIVTDAVVAWADVGGNAGLRYENFPASARENFAHWAAAQGKSADADAPASGAASA